MVSSTTVDLSSFEIIMNPGIDRWLELIHLTNVDEGWICAKDDYQSWVNGVGEENYRFYCAVHKETQKFAGAVIRAVMPSVDGSPRLATVGMFYVRPEFRKTGLGLHLFTVMMKGEEENNVGLNGVLAMTAKYSKRFGFDKYSPWKESNHMAAISDISTSNIDVDSDIAIVDLKNLDWEQYMRFDVHILNGVRRDGYIKNYLTQTGAHNRFATSPEGRVVGVCNIRECYSGDLVLGPFYADDTEIAAALLKATLDSIPNMTDFNSLLLVTPDTNTDSIELFDRLASGRSKHCGYMMSQYTKEAIAVPDKKVYSFTDYANNFV